MTKKTDVQLPLATKAGIEIGKARLAAGLGKVALGLLGVVQVAFAFLAFVDLASRSAKEVRGPKLAWVPVILINWIGPAAYFLGGIRHRR
jgi:hypothetical protein